MSKAVALSYGGRVLLTKDGPRSIGPAAGPAVNALAIASAPKGGEGEALTLPKTAGDLVFLVGPIVIGLTDDFLGSPGSSLGLVSGTAAAAAVGALMFLDPKQKEDDEERRGARREND